MSLIHVIIVSIIVESVWETIKMIKDNGFNLDKIGAMLIGILIAVGFRNAAFNKDY